MTVPFLCLHPVGWTFSQTFHTIPTTSPFPVLRFTLYVQMFLHHLSLTNFRSLTRLDVEVPTGTIVIVGDNAQGKTSVLEAIFMLATLSAFNAESERELINFFAAREPLAVARIKADFRRGERGDERLHHLEIRIIQENGRVRKETLLDGVKRKVNEVVGQFNAVLFLPQMMSIVDGSPSHRRRYLDLALSQVIPGYSDALANYTRTLEQRNALLKQLGERSSGRENDQEQLAFWDEQLTNLGARIIHARIHAIHEMEILAALTHRELTQGREVLRLTYQPAYDP
ncbi:MAG TPA: DNA replication and repair protein RecF, partial [Anaerolineales bacterium]|nr:DNA replication and repair protein RecF [Anaerolineales bacterium]